MDLETKRLTLSKLSKNDIPLIHELNSREDVARYNTLGIPDSLETTAKYLEPIILAGHFDAPRMYSWALRTKEDQQFIGELGMSLFAERFKRAEIYYNLLPEFWGKGYASEAVEGLLNFGFNTLKLHRIEAGVATENERSIKLLERLGMQYEGRHRKILPINGEWKDNFHYAMLETDYSEIHKQQ